MCRQVLPFEYVLVNEVADALKDQLNGWQKQKVNAIFLHVVKDVRVNRCDRHPIVVGVENLLYIRVDFGYVRHECLLSLFGMPRVIIGSARFLRIESNIYDLKKIA